MTFVPWRAGALLAVWFNFAWSYPDGAPPGHTGGFDEPDCTACHLQIGETERPRLHLEGLQDNDIARGRTLHLELVVTHHDIKTAGAQLSIRFPGSQTQAGVIESNAMQKTGEGPIVYLTHREPAPAPDGRAKFGFTWHLPDKPATAVINAAAVASNDDDSPLGDFVGKFEQVLNFRAR